MFVLKFDLESEPDDELLTVATARRENPRFFLFAGLVLIADGLAAIALISLAGFTAEKIVAVFMAVSGFTLLLHAFSARGGSQVIPLEFLMALLHLSLGFVALLYPFVGVYTLAQWLAVFLLAEGGLRLAIAVNFRSARGTASVASIGAIEVLLGLVLLALAGAGGQLIGLFLGADLVLGGICMVNIYRTGRAPCEA